MHQPKTIILLPKPNERIKKKVNENATVLGVKLIQRNDKKHFFFMGGLNYIHCTLCHIIRATITQTFLQPCVANLLLLKPRHESIE